MAGILLPPWTQQPQHQAVADRSNPLTLGLEYLFNAAPSAYPVNLVDGKAASLVGTGLTKINSGVGVGWNVPSSGKSFTIPHKGFSYPLTLFALVSSPRPTNASGGLFGLNKSGSNSLGLWTDSDYSSMNYARFVTTNTIVGTAGSASRISDKSGKLVVLVSRSSTDHTLYVDGVVAATSAVAGPAIDSTYTLEFLREVDYGSPSLWVYSGTTISMPMAGGYSRALSSSEVYALSRNPWQLFKAPKRRIWVNIGGSISSISALGSDQASGSATLTANVALAGVGVAVAGGSAAASVSVPLSAAGIAVAGGGADATATVSVEASGLAQAAGAAGLSATVLLAGAGAAQASGNAALAAQLSALAAGAAQAGGAANLTGGAAGSVSAAGGATAGGAAALVVTVQIAAAGAAQAGGAASLSGGAPGGISAAGGATASGSATISVQVALTAAGFAQAMGAGYWVVTVPIYAAGGGIASGAAIMAGAGPGIVFNVRVESTNLSLIKRRQALQTSVRPRQLSKARRP